MDERTERRLMELAARIADGRPVDWSDPATSEAALGPITHELRLLDEMAGWLRGPVEDTPLRHEAPRLEGFTIEREIGSGGSGVVYLARDNRLQRSVALKVLPGEVALDSDRLAHVEREARMLASLNHPNIATIYGMAVDTRGSHVLMLEYVAGDTLARRLRSGSMPVGESLAIGLQVAEALAAAHEGGVIHRDLKPGNVMIGPHGRVKVLDFGLARRRGVAATEAGPVVAGTWAYLSPECLMRGEDHRADVFAFGCVLYECLSGRRAFGGERADEVLAAVIGKEPDWDALAGETPPSIRELLARCLEKDPAKRLDRMDLAQRVIAEALHPGRATSAGEPIGPGFPPSASPFIGRVRELAELREALRATRIVTLTGPGGSGKTRLAIQTAAREHARFPSLHFVDLAPVSDPARVPDAVASAIGVRGDEARPLLERIRDRLADSPSLLILDNCEPVAKAAAELVRVLVSGAPPLTVLATSRVPLGLDGERRLALEPLELPDESMDPEQLRRVDSVRLFLDRAERLQPGFPTDASTLRSVAEICRRVDGLPLAIELAAGRVNVLSVREIASRLDRQLALLKAGGRAARRHETMRATLAWSVEQLGDTDARIFRRLAVFVGGCDLAGAMAVCEVADDFEMLDALGSLADQSLLRVERLTEGVTRYRFLEPVRQFALERLADSGEASDSRGRHLSRFLALAESSGQALYGPDQAVWFRRFEVDLDNFVAALATARAAAEGAEATLRMVLAIQRLFITRGEGRLAEEAFEWALEQRAELPTELRARSLYALAKLLLNRDIPDRSRITRALDEARELHRALGDLRGVTACEVVLGQAATEDDELDRAERHFESALEHSRESGYTAATVAISHSLGILRWKQGDFAGALDRLEDAQRTQRTAPASEDRSNSANRAAVIAYCSMRLGRREAARVALVEAVGFYREMGARGGNLATVLLGTSDYLEDAGAIETAVLLFGAEDAMASAVHSEKRWYSMFGKRRDEMLDRFRRALGESALDALLARGRRLSAADAIRLAEDALGVDRG